MLEEVAGSLGDNCVDGVALVLKAIDGQSVLVVAEVRRSHGVKGTKVLVQVDVFRGLEVLGAANIHCSIFHGYPWVREKTKLRASDLCLTIVDGATTRG